MSTSLPLSLDGLCHSFMANIVPSESLLSLRHALMSSSLWFAALRHAMMRGTLQNIVDVLSMVFISDAPSASELSHGSVNLPTPVFARCSPLD